MKRKIFHISNCENQNIVDYKTVFKTFKEKC